MPNQDKIKELKEVYILLRMSCELKCKICPYWGENGACDDLVFKKRYINKEEALIDVKSVKKFIDQILIFKPKMITLSGGEPLMFKGWVEIAKYVKSKGIKVSLSTNGLHLNKFFEPILKYIDSIQLNLGGTKEILSKTRGANYGFDLVIKNIKTIAELKKKKKQIFPFIRIIYVVSDLSYRHLVEFYEYFKNNNIEVDDFYFQHFMSAEKKIINEQSKLLKKFGMKVSLWQGYKYNSTKVDTDYLLEQIKKLLPYTNVKFSPQMNEAEIKNYYSKRKNLIKRDYACRAPWEQVDLYPNGDIMTCPDCIIGNIFKNTFSDIWNGEKNYKIKDYITKKKEMPGCRSCFYYYVTNEKYQLK